MASMSQVLTIVSVAVIVGTLLAAVRNYGCRVLSNMKEIVREIRRFKKKQPIEL